MKRVFVFLLTATVLLSLCGCGGGGTITRLVLSNSMSPEFETGDTVVCRKKTEKDTISPGDVILFHTEDENTTVIHRVVAITTGEDGSPRYITRGDANNAEDAYLVPEENVIGIYTGKVIKGK